MPGQELRVLVIDDEPDIAAMLVDSIEFLGYRALAAHNGLDGARMADEFQPHVVLLDLVMSGMDGRHVLQYLRGTHPTLPVVIVSGTQDGHGALADAGRRVGLRPQARRPRLPGSRHRYRHRRHRRAATGRPPRRLTGGRPTRLRRGACGMAAACG